MQMDTQGVWREDQNKYGHKGVMLTIGYSIRHASHTTSHIHVYLVFVFFFSDSLQRMS